VTQPPIEPYTTWQKIGVGVVTAATAIAGFGAWLIMKEEKHKKKGPNL
jgi:hypothetical protein